MPTVASIYNPNQLTKSELIDRFVVRFNVYQRLFKDIRESSMNYPEQHILIQGQRGMGKTTLLLRLSYEIEHTPELNTWLIPVVFNEEQYNISRLFRLWETIAEYLERINGSFKGLYDKMDILYDKYKEETDCEKYACNLLIEKLQSQGKKLVLFIDNFGDMLSKFDKKEHQRLRTVLMTCSDIRIIAASAKLPNHLFDYNEPFYEFFKIERLKGLNQKDTESLLLKLGESLSENTLVEIVAEQKYRIEVLRRITGGILRTIVLLFEVFTDNQNGNIFNDLEQILDRVSPLYKHRMDDLPKQQQEIMDAMALHWDAISINEIAQKARLPKEQVTDELKKMLYNGVIDAIPAKNKEHLYAIHERFFNIWYLMRNGRKRNKKRVMWLLRFFEEWCDKEMFKERVQQHINYLKLGSYHTKGALMLSEAFAQSNYLNWEEQDELLGVTKTFLKEKDELLLDELSESDKVLFEKGYALFEANKYKDALDKFLKICYPNNDVFFCIAYIFGEEKNYNKAEDYYLKAIHKGDTHSIYNLAILYYQEFEDYEKAERYFLMAIEKGNVEAMNNIATLYIKQYKNYKQAEKYLLMAVENDLSYAMNGLGMICWNEFGDYERAEKYLLMGIEKGSIEAMNNMGLFYMQGSISYSKAEKYFLMAIKKGNINAMNNLGILYRIAYEDNEKAEKYFLMAFNEKKKLDDSYNEGLFYQVYFTKNGEELEKNYSENSGLGRINSILNLAILYQDKKDYKKAEQYYLMAVKKGKIKAMSNLAWLYVEIYDDYEKAEKYFLMAIEKKDIHSMNSLAYLYYQKAKNKDKALLLIKEAYQKAPNRYFSCTLAKNLLWNNQYDKSFETAEEFIYDVELMESQYEVFTNYLLLIISKKQYPFLYNYFTSTNTQSLQLKDRFRPIYYALMDYMQDQYPDEHKRMGSELQETVQEIIKKVEEMALKYA